MDTRLRSIAWARAALAGIAFAVTGAAAAPAETMSSSAGALRVSTVVEGLETPWGFDFLPGGEVLITEKRGRLLWVRDGEAVPVGGVPRVADRGQGGLLDIMVPRDFATSREIFLSYAKPQDGGAGTALASGRLSPDGRLQQVQVLFEMAPGSSGGRHFGSRIVEAPDGRLFLTVGERGDRPAAQDLSRHEGSVIRINRDGSVPDTNPFVGRVGVQPEIWSYGHRNPQGAALDAAGQLWVNEHGARGGDEINRVEAGVNFGWPVISYGRHYSGMQIGEGTQKPGMAQPAHYWDPSIAPAGLMVYSGRLWPQWEGDFFSGSLKFGLISRVDGETMQEAERLEGPRTGRVRDIAEGPDGAIWYLSEADGALYRLSPAEG